VKPGACRASRFAACALLASACLQGPGETRVDPFKPAEQALGERVFRDPRFSQWFATHASGLNAPPTAGDPTVAVTANAAGPALPGALAGTAVACSACHLVEQDALADGTRMRAYADFARSSPIPDRGDGASATARNSPPMVDALVPRPGPVFLHLDGQFVTAEDLIAATFTGRNLGWLPGESDAALNQLADVIRGDDGHLFQGPDPSGMSYAVAFLSEDGRILPRLRLPAAYRLDVFAASDAEVLAALARVVAAYMGGLHYHRDTGGAYDASPYDVFLAKNALPRTPDSGESPLAYARRLRTAVESLNPPRWVTAADGQFIHHAQPFAFGPVELHGLEVFLAEPLGPFRPPAEGGGGVGNCLACHPPPDFTDHLFHNTGASQVGYDAVHGAGAFLALAVPDVGARGANPDAFLPASAAHPGATGRFKSLPEAADVARADLGLWNVFANPDVPAPQAALLDVLCPEVPAPQDCTAAALLPRTVARFKTPSLRDLDDSAPYLHDGSALDVGAVLSKYQRVSDLQRAGALRNGDARLAGVNLGPEDTAALQAFLDALAEDYQ
jgi:hypothetical protein